MISITASTAGSLRVEATDGVNSAVMDEAVDGAVTTALSPKQMLASALAGCTAMTLKMYSARKDWPLDDVRVTVEIEPAPRAEKDAPNRIVQRVELIGDLDDAQRERLRVIAGKCPVHKILEGPNLIEEHLVEPATAKESTDGIA